MEGVEESNTNNNNNNDNSVIVGGLDLLGIQCEVNEFLLIETEINSVMAAMKTNSRWAQRSRMVI